MLQIIITLRNVQCYPLGGDIEVSRVKRRVRSHKARLLPVEEVGLVEKGGKA